MKIPPFLTTGGALLLAWLLCSKTAVFVYAADGKYAQDGKFLNVAMLTLPDRYLADIPLEKRTTLLMRLSDSAFEDRRLDYENGWLCWYSDEHPDFGPGATSMFWLKLLPRTDGRPLLFVHMAKPRADGKAPRENQTYLLQRSGKDWIDVTRDFMPEGVDLTMHFRPRRLSHVIEVGPWKQFERRDGRGLAYTYGPREMDLIWEDGAFRVTEPDGEEMTKDF